MWSVIGIGILVYIFILFFKRIGETIPLLEFLLLISGLQWILGPLIEYNTPFNHYKYHMYVPEDEYMSIVAPAFVLFAVVLLYAAKRYPLYFFEQLNLSEFAKYGLIFIGIGLVAEAVSSFIPGSLSFFFMILSNFKFIGAIILFFSPKRSHRQLFYGAIILLLITSLQSGFFHNFILWSVFFFLFWALRYKPSRVMKASIFILGFISLTVIQGVKMQYREALFSGSYDGNFITLFTNTLTTQFESGYFQESENTQGLNVRLNQGWIISAVIDHVPENEDFARGETVKEAIFASILPRFLNPDKKEAGGRENFAKYTGLPLGENTSMGISIIGEFYANYGQYAILAMGIWGFFLLQVWRFLYIKQQSIPFVIFFLPLLFLQVVKAETELVVVLNHLVKSGIVIFAFFYFTKNVLHWSIYYPEEQEENEVV